MGRMTWIKTESFFVFFCREFFSARSRSRKEGGRGTKEEAQTEREKRVRKRRRTVEEERKEGSGVASTLDWNLKIPGSILGSTLREIIHPKTTDLLFQSKPHVKITIFSLGWNIFIVIFSHQMKLEIFLNTFEQSIRLDIFKVGEAENGY